MQTAPLTSDDPRLTAYALGELDAADRAAVEAALAADPALRAAVAEIRAAAQHLEAAFSAESAATPAPTAAAARRPAPRRAAIFRFPTFYYVAGGLAAACFAVVVAVQREELDARQKARGDALRVAMEKRGAEAGARGFAADSTFAVTLPPAPSADASAQATLPADLSLLGQAAAAAPSPGAGPVSLDSFSAAPPKAGAAGLPLAGGSPRRTAAVGGNVVLASAAKSRAPALADRPGPVETPAATRGTEAYSYFGDNPFLRVADHPLSTFAAEADTASYTNVRRMLAAGVRPPPDAVRIEELVNWFPYRYAPPAPGSAAPFAAALEVAAAPWAPAHRLVRIGLKGREVTTAARPAANLVFLLDVSGSMQAPNKLPLVKESLRLLLGRLRADDRVAIVTYAGQSGLALPSTPAARSREILAALDALVPGGGTHGSLGIQLAYDIAKANFAAGGINRVILCTDGDFNVGVTNEGDLVRLIADKAASGVYLTVLGFGMGNYKDATLERLAGRGNGHYGYIDTLPAARKLLVEEVEGSLVTIAQDVKLQVEFNPARVARYRLIGYENRVLRKEEFNDDRVDAGEIGAGHTVTALYEIVPAGAAGSETAGAPPVDDLKYTRPVPAAAGIAPSADLLTVKVRYKEPGGTESRKLEFPLADSGAAFAAASADFRFAAAVAQFGMLLRKSEHRGTATFGDVIAWAAAAATTPADDPHGYRSDFLDLARQAQELMKGE